MCAWVELDGRDSIMVIVVLANASRPIKAGYGREVTSDVVEELLEQTGGYVGMICGRLVRVQLSDDGKRIATQSYDEWNGPGAAAAVIAMHC